MQIAANKTIALATTEATAQQVANTTGGRAEATTVCKKLGVDYMIYGPAPSSKQGRANRIKRAVDAQRPKGKGSRSYNFGRLAVRKQRMEKAARRLSRLHLFRQGRMRLTIAGVLPVAGYGAEHAPWDRQKVYKADRSDNRDQCYWCAQ